MQKRSCLADRNFLLRRANAHLNIDRYNVYGQIDSAPDKFVKVLFRKRQLIMSGKNRNRVVKAVSIRCESANDARICIEDVHGNAWNDAAGRIGDCTAKVG
jgi:hypothetical protein